MSSTTQNLDYARKWRGLKVRDTKTNELGLIIGATEEQDEVKLICIFPSQGQILVSLEKTADLECLVPGYARARYRIAD
jgi:hypothetical protein